MNLEEIEGFVNNNKFAVNENNTLARCVDGRYENINDIAAIAKPGADAGDAMIVFGALNLLEQTLSTEKIIDLVIENVGGIGKFRFHTDDHADTAVLGLGCGHLKQAKLDPIAYGLQQSQIDYIFDQLPQLVERGAKQEVLHGNHSEQAVVVVNSEKYSLAPMAKLDDFVQEVFVYQKTLHEQQLDRMSRMLQEVFATDGVVLEVDVIKNALDQAFEKQLTETLKRLATGLPVYAVHIDETGLVNVNQ